MSRKKIVGIVILNALIITMFSGLLVLKNMYPDGPQVWLDVPGLIGEVYVYKDDYGVPHIYADNITDLYFAQGYIQAEDRLFQMDLMRRAGRGTLAEIFGADLVSSDLYLRAIGIPKTAAETYLVLNSTHHEVIALVQRYVDGINFYLAHHRGNLPLEYTLLELNGLVGYRVPDFNVTDVLGMVGIMSNMLAFGGLDEEINAYNAIKTFGADNATQLFPIESFKDHPVDLAFPNITTLEYVGSSDDITDISPTGGVSYTLPEVPRDSPILGELFRALSEPGIGSNNWVVGGSNTTSGYALLANDPHLGLSTPSIWHQYHLYAADVGLNVTGVTLPLAPGVVIGHNEHIAWGVTNSGVDVVDCYSLNESSDQSKFLYNTTWVNFEYEDGVIPVFGADPVSYRVKLAPGFGPLLNAGGYKVAVKWVAANATDLVLALQKLDLANNYAEFKDAIQYWDCPSQNFVYADLDGVIAYWTPGKIPIRENDQGIVPTNGSTGLFDWVDYVKFNDLPHYDNVNNTERWYFATANARVVNASYNATYLASYFDQPFRRDRIMELIESYSNDGDKMTFDEMNEIQADILSVPARTLMKNVTDAMTTLNFTISEKVLLTSWNYSMAGDSPAATVWHYFLERFINFTFLDEYQSFTKPEGLSLPYWSTIINMTLTNCSGPFYSYYWFDDVSTPLVYEHMTDIIIHAMRDTFDTLYADTKSTSFGDFAWSKYQTITWPHEMGNQLGGLLSFLNNGPFPWHSDSDCVESGNPDWRPSMHFICQVSPWMGTASLVNAPGECGNVMGSNYRSQVDLYLNHQYHFMPFSTQDVLGNTTLWATFLP